MSADTTPGIRLRIESIPDAGGVVAHVTIDHERKLNALNTPLLREFADAIGEIGKRDDLRAAVVTGAGTRAFVGGADIREMAAIRDGASARRFIEGVHAACRAVRDLPVPVIARVNGYALGAGLELMASCDLRVAADNAHFGMPEVLVGLPSVVEASVLPGLIGWGRTRRLLLLGETVGAAEAEAWGLVERVVPAAALDGAVADWVAKLCAAGPRAVRIQKRLIRDWEALSPDAGAVAGIDAFASAWDSDEPARMLNNFLDRKKA